MKFYKALSVFILVILATIWFTSAAYAGFRIGLEKDVPKGKIKGVPSDVSFKIFVSEIASTPIASQTFPSGSWSHRYVSQAKFRPFPLRPKKGPSMVRFRAEFTNTTALTKDMELWMEIYLDGTKKGVREKIDQEAWALFSEEAFLADEATHAINADTASDVTCTNCVELGAETSGGYDPTPDTIADDGVISSGEVDFMGSNSTNFIPKWDGSALVSGSIYDNNGKVGIGTTAPGTKFEVSTGGIGGTQASFGDDIGVNQYISVGYRSQSGKAALFGITQSSGIAWMGMAGDNIADGQGLIVKQGGNVGIGTANPTEKLEVNGNALITGNLGVGGNLQGVGFDALEESAEINDKIEIHRSNPNAHHTQTTRFTDLTDTATDAQIPDDITINHATTAGNASNVNCTNCVSLGTETSGSYDSTPDTIADDGVISNNEVNFNYAGSISKGGAANNLSCAGCVSQSELDFTVLTANDDYGRPGVATNLYEGTTRLRDKYLNDDEPETISALSSSQTLRVVNTGSGHGLYVESSTSTDNKTALKGWVKGSTGNTFGIQGLTSSDAVGNTGSSAGVFGLSLKTGSVGDVFGVLGEIRGSGGAGPGPNMAAGVYGVSYASSGISVGVVGDSASSDASGAGVFGINKSLSGNTRGVWGEAKSPTGKGVYGRNTWTNGWGVYSEGNFEVARFFRTLADGWSVRSSRRWKTEIAPIEDALDKIKRLKGVYFDWKESGKHDIGLIAEDVGEVIPEIVEYEENGQDAKSIDYSRLVSVLIEAVKEQQKDIDALKEEIIELQQQRSE